MAAATTAATTASDLGRECPRVAGVKRQARALDTVILASQAWVALSRGDLRLGLRLGYGWQGAEWTAERIQIQILEAAHPHAHVAVQLDAAVLGQGAHAVTRIVERHRAL